MTCNVQLLAKRGKQCLIGRELALSGEHVHPRHGPVRESGAHELEIFLILSEDLRDGPYLAQCRRNLNCLRDNAPRERQIGGVRLALLILRKRLALLHRACDTADVVGLVLHRRARSEIAECR